MLRHSRVACVCSLERLLPLTASTAHPCGMVRNKTIKTHCFFHLNQRVPRPGIHSKTFQEADWFGFGSPREPNFDALPVFGCLQNVAAGSRICCTRWYQGGLVAPSPTSDVQLHQPQLRCGQRLAPSARDKHHTLVSVGSPTVCASGTKLSLGCSSYLQD